MSVGDDLKGLMARAGMTVREFAKASGYAHGSGVQRYISPDYDAPLPVQVAQRMADALDGKGSPPIKSAEVLALTGLVPEPNAILAPPMEGPSAERMTRDVPVYGTALGADEIVDGEAIEQTTLNRAEVIEYRRRPVLLDGRADVYALYVQGQSMDPRHRDGAILFVEQKKRPAVGEDAVIYLRAPDEHDGERPTSVLIKTLVKKSASYIELEQYNPRLTFCIPMERVARMDRVITLDELTD